SDFAAVDRPAPDMPVMMTMSGVPGVTRSLAFSVIVSTPRDLSPAPGCAITSTNAAVSRNSSVSGRTPVFGNTAVFGNTPVFRNTAVFRDTVQRGHDRLGQFRPDAGHGRRDLVRVRRRDVLHRTERLQQRGPPGRAEAGNGVERRGRRGLAPL